METLEKIHESGVAPTEVWYLSTLILTGILVLFIGIMIFFVKGFFSRLQETLDKFQESISKLTTLTTLHDKEIENINKRLEKGRR